LRRRDVHATPSSRFLIVKNSDAAFTAAMRPFRLSLVLLAVLTGLITAPSARAGGTLAWPPPTLPPGSNSASTPAPRMDWFLHFQSNLDASRKQPKIDLIFDGDSITDHWTTVGKDLWAQHYAPLNAFDFGISGDRTENLLWRLQNGQVDGLHPKLVVLLIGTNNLSYNTPEQIAEGIKASIDEYFKHCPDTTILLQGVFPRVAKADDTARAKIKTLNQLISKFADGKKVLYIDFGDKFLQPDGTLSADIMPDFLHPSPKGYQIWVDAIQPEIDQFFPGTPH